VEDSKGNGSTDGSALQAAQTKEENLKKTPLEK